MTEQVEQATAEDTRRQFWEAVAQADRVQVHKLNALGEYDTHNFGPAAIAALTMTPQEAAKVLEWRKGRFKTTDDDNGPREGTPRYLHAWKADGFTIIKQDSESGLYLLKPASGMGSAWPSLEQAKDAALRAISEDSHE